MSQVDSTQNIGEYDDNTQAAIRKIMFDQKQKVSGSVRFERRVCVLICSGFCRAVHCAQLGVSVDTDLPLLHRTCQHTCLSLHMIQAQGKPSSEDLAMEELLAKASLVPGSPI